MQVKQTFFIAQRFVISWFDRWMHIPYGHHPTCTGDPGSSCHHPVYPGDPDTENTNQPAIYIQPEEDKTLDAGTGPA